MLNVRSGSLVLCEAKATIDVESIPPLRKTPTGTSLTKCRLDRFPRARLLTILVASIIRHFNSELLDSRRFLFRWSLTGRQSK